MLLERLKWLRKKREESFYGDIDFISTEEYMVVKFVKWEEVIWRRYLCQFLEPINMLRLNM